MEWNCRFGSCLASSATLLLSVNLWFRVQSLVMFPFNRFVRLLPPSLPWVPWPPVSRALRFPTFVGVGSEEARRRAGLRPPPKLHVQFSRMQLSRRLRHAEMQEKGSTRSSSQAHTHGTAS